MILEIVVPGYSATLRRIINHRSTYVAQKSGWKCEVKERVTYLILSGPITLSLFCNHCRILLSVTEKNPFVFWWYKTDKITWFSWITLHEKAVLVLCRPKRSSLSSPAWFASSSKVRNKGGLCSLFHVASRRNWAINHFLPARVPVRIGAFTGDGNDNMLYHHHHHWLFTSLPFPHSRSPSVLAINSDWKSSQLLVRRPPSEGFPARSHA